jgi:hypothetical protein
MSNESKEWLNAPDGMDRSTATGRPYKAPSRADKSAAAFDSVMAGDGAHFSFAGVNHLPVKFTDDSILSIPVLPQGAGQVAADKKKRFWSRRKSENTNFVMKEMSRGDYLKHYAKDEQGKYIGTDEPAEDCILRGEDLEKYKRATTFRNEIDGAEDKEDRMIR